MSAYSRNSQPSNQSTDNFSERSFPFSEQSPVIIDGEYLITLKDKSKPITETGTAFLLRQNITESVNYLESFGIKVKSVMPDGFTIFIPNNLSLGGISGLENNATTSYGDVRAIFNPGTLRGGISGLQNNTFLNMPATDPYRVCEESIKGGPDSNIEFCVPNRIGGGVSSGIMSESGLNRLGGSYIYNENRIFSNVTIAIMDSGVYPHPYINLIGNVTFRGDNNDHENHGTHVAGIAAAEHNPSGIVGVAPGAKIFSIKVIQSGTTDEVLAKALRYIIDNADKIDVVNLSIWFPPSPILDKYIAEAVEKGVTFVGAAGNFKKDASEYFPGSSPNVILVSSMSDNDGRCGGKGGQVNILELNNPATRDGSPMTDRDDSFSLSYSNYGNAVDLVAPGTNINSTSNDGSFVVRTGTSMAAPFVTGAIARYIQDNPEASPEQIRAAIVVMR